MREIEFRGKRIDNGEWVYGDLIQYGKYKSIKFIDEEYKKYEYPVYPESVGQFTGLLDKNRKKIFEGDVVRTFHGQKYVCVFKNSGFKFENIITKNYAIYSELWKIEIIGNVTDNPELLK